MVMDIERGPRLQKLENFLLHSETIESTTYVADLLAGNLKRPEETFVQKILNDSFWEEMGYSEKERKFEAPAGISGRVEWSLEFEEKKIAIECKRPYKIQKEREEIHQLDGNDIDELENQLGRYLEDHDYIIFTNGFYWFFYSQVSYRTWKHNKDKITKGSEINPYFKKLTYKEIFDENSPDYILNILPRSNILDTLRSMEHKSIRNPLARDFFEDLKNWIDYLDVALKNTDEKTKKISATALLNKLIFLRTMEGVGIISSDFVGKLWDAGKEVNTTISNFVNQLDDGFSEKFNTELFTPQYLEDRHGERILKEGLPVENPERKKNLIYEVIPSSFFSSILKRTDGSNLKDTGKERVVVNGQIFYLRSLYWWKFEKITGDILGKAYETYLALQRKKLGIYYTPDQLTEYVSLNSINQIFDKQFSELQEEFTHEKWNIEKINLIGDNLMDIKICDPSCGSGSFLIQAMRLVWKKYLKLEQIIEEQDEKFAKGKSKLDAYFTSQVGVLRYFQEIVLKRDDKQLRMGTIILRHIHGNDKDERAVSTTKLNIWLECLRLDPNSYKMDVLEGKRHVLPNLELNLNDGDSLIDIDIEVMDASFDDEIRGTISSIFKLRQKYLDYFDMTSNAHDASIMRDSLIDVFVLPKFKEIIGESLYGKLTKKLKPTFWGLQYWNAFYDKNGNLKPKEQRGFDIIVGNPPWEKLKVLEKEFFAIASPEIAKASTASIRKKMIQDLEENDLELYQEYVDAKEQAEIIAEYLRKSKRFPFSAVGELNLYSLFLELSHNLLKKDGILGMIVQTGILTDSSYQKFFENLVFTSSIIACHDFTNKLRIFKDVEENMRFCLLFLTSEGSDNEKFSLSVLNEKIEDIEKRTSKFSKKDLILFNPNTKTCPLFVNNQDYILCKKIYQNNSILMNTENNGNPWNLVYWRMFDMSTDSGLFEQKESLIKKGFTMKENSWFIKNDLKYIPLYESKLLSNNDHRHGTFEGVTIEKRFGVKAKTNSPTIDEKNNPDYEIEPRYWVSEKDVKNKYKLQNISTGTCFAFRDVCRGFTDMRTAKGTLIPFSGVGNTAPVLIFRNNDEDSRKKEMIMFSHLFSSFVFDYVVRQKISGAHLSKYILAQIAAPTPSKFKEMNLRYGDDIKTVENWLLEKASQIFPVSNNFKDLFKILKISKPIKWDESHRFDQICFVNAIIAHVYGLNKKDFEYIMNQFPILKKQEEEKHGEFISLNKCLDYFSKLQIEK